MSSPQQLLMEQNGVPGGQYETANTTDVTGEWFAVQAIEATTISSGADCNISNLASSSCVVPAGSTIFGDFSVVKCSGKAILYHK